MVSAAAAVTLELRGGATGGATAKLLRGAVPAVQYWLDQWSDLIGSALAGPTTVVLSATTGELQSGAGEVVVNVGTADISDAESARSAVLAAALDGVALACRTYPRQPSIEVQAPPDLQFDEGADVNELEGFGEAEMAVFAYLDGDPSLSHDRFEEIDDILERTLHGVAALQDSTVVNGFGQWVIGRASPGRGAGTARRRSSRCGPAPGV